jgi:import inner membrane translocase subunit TIM44
MCQQINCVRKKETGEIVEGSEDDIRANSYVCAFQREYNEEEGELNWKIGKCCHEDSLVFLSTSS